jgi:hypothetical protein
MINGALQTVSQRTPPPSNRLPLDLTGAADAIGGLGVNGLLPEPGINGAKPALNPEKPPCRAHI